MNCNVIKICILLQKLGYSSAGGDKHVEMSYILSTQHFSFFVKARKVG
jgi:hypothetical protein